MIIFARLLANGKTNVVYTAFYNTALIRYMDFMDDYFAKGGLCHPSDNIGAILATMNTSTYQDGIS